MSMLTFDGVTEGCDGGAYKDGGDAVVHWSAHEGTYPSVEHEEGDSDIGLRPVELAE